MGKRYFKACELDMDAQRVSFYYLHLISDWVPSERVVRPKIIDVKDFLAATVAAAPAAAPAKLALMDAATPAAVEVASQAAVEAVASVMAEVMDKMFQEISQKHADSKKLQPMRKKFKGKYYCWDDFEAMFGIWAKYKWNCEAV